MGFTPQEFHYKRKYSSTCLPVYNWRCSTVQMSAARMSIPPPPPTSHTHPRPPSPPHTGFSNKQNFFLSSQQNFFLSSQQLALALWCVSACLLFNRNRPELAPLASDKGRAMSNTEASASSALATQRERKNMLRYEALLLDSAREERDLAFELRVAAEVELALARLEAEAGAAQRSTKRTARRSGDG